MIALTIGRSHATLRINGKDQPIPTWVKWEATNYDGEIRLFEDEPVLRLTEGVWHSRNLELRWIPIADGRRPRDYTQTLYLVGNN